MQSGQGVRGLSPKACEEELDRDPLLCVSFECDSLSEELGRKKEGERGKKVDEFFLNLRYSVYG